MSFAGSTLARSRSRVATAHRRGDPEEIAAARRDFAAEKIADYVERTLATAPPLSDEQLDRIADLLTAGGGVDV